MSGAQPPAAMAAPVRRAAPPPLRWRSWPLEEGGAVAWLLTAALLSLTALVGWIMASAVWAVVACGLLALAAWRYFVPVHFEINPQGIFQEALGRRRRISWRSIGYVQLCRDGLLLAPARLCCPSLGGLYLPWGRRRSEVLALVSYYLQQVGNPDLAFDFELAV